MKALRDAGARFLALQVRANSDAEFDLCYFFESDTGLERVDTRTEEQCAPSLIAQYAKADWAEREAYRQHQIKFLGNPNLSQKESA